MGDYRSYLIDNEECDRNCALSSYSHGTFLFHKEADAKRELISYVNDGCNNIKVYEIYNLKPIKWQPKELVKTIEFLDRDDLARFVGEKV